jgi:hypothetical protein
LKLFKKIKNRFLRILLIVGIILFIFVAIVIAFISPIAKYAIEKYDEKFTGRQIELSWIYINPFTGYIGMHGLQVHERNSEDVFLKANKISARLTLRALFSKTLDLSSFTLDNAAVSIIQDSAGFNFSDFIKKDSVAIDTLVPKEAFHYCVRNISIINTEIHYRELNIPVYYYIKNFNLDCPRTQWDIDTTYFKYDFNSGPADGAVKGEVTVDLKNKKFKSKTEVIHFDLKPMEQYVKDFANYGNLIAFLDANMNASGSFDDPKQLKSNGKFALSNFHFGKVKGDDYLAFNKMSVNIDSLSPANRKYFFSSFLLDSPYVKYERYDSLDNFSRMFGVKGKNVTQAKTEHPQTNIIFLISDFIKEIAENIVNSQYYVDELKIQRAILVYNDYGLMEEFSINAKPIVITAKNISTKNKRMSASLNMQLNPFGEVNVNFDVNPNDFGDFHLKYNINQLPLPMFNPYTVTLTSYPFHRGKVAFFGTWNVINKQINSDNHLVIENPTTARKVKNKETKKVPVPLIMAFVRDWDRRIDVEMPITGSLNDPHFNVWDAIWDVLANILVKPPTYPYRATKQSQKVEKEKYELMEWQPMQVKMNGDQKDQMRKISRYLFFHRNSKLVITPLYFQQLEKEYIMLYEAKKKYYLKEHNLAAENYTEDDSVEVSKLSAKDSAFVKYLDRATNASSLEFTVQGKCQRLVGKARVDKLYNSLLERRKKEILEFFSEKYVTDRVNFKKGTATFPAIGFSHYIFDYRGEQPEELEKEKKKEK